MATEELATGPVTVPGRYATLGGSGTSCSYWSTMIPLPTLRFPTGTTTEEQSPLVPVMGAANWGTRAAPPQGRPVPGGDASRTVRSSPASSLIVLGPEPVLATSPALEGTLLHKVPAGPMQP